MTQYAIRAENLGKQYHIGQVTNRHPTLRDFLMGLVRAPIERFRNVMRGQGARTDQEAFWALKDVSFDVERGTVLGVIGRNGSGKSTLLKILSRITDPNTGFAELHGRVGSLLEVGTGFHPELTGRENIYLNGAMLGMRRREIHGRFDEIVGFSEVEKFLDTPVKHYSSGMYMRLAFAVAAHLETEIMIVDEVLAVGDPAFQKKCLAKMESVSRNGRTVLVVSHSLPIIQTKCHSCIWLDAGRMKRAGDPQEIIAEYVKNLTQLQTSSLEERSDRAGNGAIRFLRVEFQDTQGREVPAPMLGEPARIVLHFANTTGETLWDVYFSFRIDSSETRMACLQNQVLDRAPDVVGRGVQSVTFTVPRWPFVQGRYSYALLCTVKNAIADHVENAGTFQVEGGDFYGSGKSMETGAGSVLLDFSFEIGKDKEPLAA